MLDQQGACSILVQKQDNYKETGIGVETVRVPGTRIVDRIMFSSRVMGGIWCFDR